MAKDRYLFGRQVMVDSMMIIVRVMAMSIVYILLLLVAQLKIMKNQRILKNVQAF